MVNATEQHSTMSAKKEAKRKGMKAPAVSLVRASISFPPDLYDNLEEIAKQKKVSLAWVVRDAADKYVANQRPSSRRH